MATLKISDLDLEGVKLIEPTYFEDYRGYYCETYSTRTMHEYGLDYVFVQDNHVYSAKKGVIRGIHFQNNPMAQAKLIRCTRGVVMDYAVDLRKDSPTFKKWIAVELSADNRTQLLIPRGFGHAVISLVDECEIQYKVDNLYTPSLDRAIAWNDPEISIDFGTDSPIVSEKDRNAPFLKDSDVNFTMGDENAR